MKEIYTAKTMPQDHISMFNKGNGKNLFLLLMKTFK